MPSPRGASRKTPLSKNISRTKVSACQEKEEEAARFGCVAKRWNDNHVSMSYLMAMDMDQDSPQVRIPPPVFLLACVLVGWGMHGLYPISLWSFPFRGIIAAVFCVTGVGVILQCAVRFQKAKTGIKPWKTTTRLVGTGFYRVSRNPIYVSFVLIAVGVAFAVDSLWILILTVPLVGILDRYVIRKEERYLESKFGEDYRNYQKRVRRWV